MKIERVRNAGRNIVSGLIMKLFQMLMPFIMRTMMFYYMGEQYLGLNSLFTSVLQVLNLAELGIGSAMVYFMYKPIAEDNEDEICALMLLYRTYYRVIGLVVAALGLILLPFLPHFISGTVPEGVNIQTLYLMNLAATVLSYWLFAYRSCVLNAHQRNDILDYVLLGSQVLQYVLQAVIVLVLRNYYLYVAAVLVTQILNNITSAFISKKMYPGLRPSGKVSREKRKDINSRIRDLFISKLGGVVLGSADTIVISAYMGLSSLAVYNNYHFIISSVCGILEVMLTGILAGIGNSMSVESEEKNRQTFRRVSILFTMLVFTCTCCLAGIFQPFMRIWMGDELMLSYGMVFSFCVYFVVYEYTRLFNTFKNAAGQWHNDRFRPLISAMLNLGLNLVFVRIIHLYGILWSSTFALGVVEIPWLLINLFKVVFPFDSLRSYAGDIGKYVLVGLLAWGVATGAAMLVRLPMWASFIVSVVVSALIPLALFVVFFRKRADFGECMEMLERMTHGRIPVRKILRVR